MGISMSTTSTGANGRETFYWSLPMEAPLAQGVKDMERWWQLLVSLFLVSCVFHLYHQDYPAATFTWIWSCCIYYVGLYDHPGRMPFIFVILGFFCLVDFLADSVTIGMIAYHGRYVERLVETPTMINGVIVNVTQSFWDHHSFFDLSMGFEYNMRSAMMILPPICMLLGLVLSYLGTMASIIYERTPGILRDLHPRMANNYGAADAREAAQDLLANVEAAQDQADGQAAGRNPRPFAGVGRKLVDGDTKTNPAPNLSERKNTKCDSGGRTLADAIDV